jgi:LPS-assembly lipoprotein
MTSRRTFAALVSLGLAGGLTGCGWEPLYADREAAPADEQLRAIRVQPISERVGQRLALALRETLNPTGIATPPRYQLSTTLQVVRLDLGVQTQGLGTRGRLDIYANYYLSEIMGGAQIGYGTSHVAESFDILANGYSNVVAEEDARTRAVEELRRDIAARLTIMMQHRATATAAK